MCPYLPYVLQSQLIKEIHSNVLHASEQIWKIEINNIDFILWNFNQLDASLHFSILFPWNYGWFLSLISRLVMWKGKNTKKQWQIWDSRSNTDTENHESYLSSLQPRIQEMAAVTWGTKTDISGTSFLKMMIYFVEGFVMRDWWICELCIIGFNCVSNLLLQWHLLNTVKYQGVKEFHLLACIGCYCKMRVFIPFKHLILSSIQGLQIVTNSNQ